MFTLPEDTKVWALLPIITYLCMLSPIPLPGTCYVFIVLTSLLYGKVSKSLQRVYGDRVDAVLVPFLPLAIVMLTYEPPKGSNV